MTHASLRDLLDRRHADRQAERAQHLEQAALLDPSNRPVTGPEQKLLLDGSNQTTTGVEQSALLDSPRRIPNTEWSRYDGVPLPAGARLIDRNTRYGNPFRLVEHGGRYTRVQSLHLHRLFLRGDPDAVARAHADGWPAHWPYGAELVALIRANLAGHDLVCTGCGPDEACHGDAVLAVARGEAP